MNKIAASVRFFFLNISILHSAFVRLRSFLHLPHGYLSVSWLYAFNVATVLRYDGAQMTITDHKTMLGLAACGRALEAHSGISELRIYRKTNQSTHSSLAFKSEHWTRRASVIFALRV